METIITAIAELYNVSDIKNKINLIGMRPGEKFHEDMLAATELPFTYDMNNDLLVVLPQYSNKKHSFDIKYNGLEFNSSQHTNETIFDLTNLIKRGIDESNE